MAAFEVGNHAHADSTGSLATLFHGHQDERRPPFLHLLRLPLSPACSPPIHVIPDIQGLYVGPRSSTINIAPGFKASITDGLRRVSQTCWRPALSRPLRYQPFRLGVPQKAQKSAVSLAELVLLSKVQQVS